MGQHTISEAKLVTLRLWLAGKDRLQIYGLFIILATFIILGLLYDFTVPFFEKPDELKHFALIQFIQRQSQLPVVRKGVYQPWDQEGTQPPLYHILAAMGAACGQAGPDWL